MKNAGYFLFITVTCPFHDLPQLKRVQPKTPVQPGQKDDQTLEYLIRSSFKPFRLHLQVNLDQVINKLPAAFPLRFLQKQDF